MDYRIVIVALAVLGGCEAGAPDEGAEGSGTSGTSAADGGSETGMDGNCEMHVLASLDEDCEGIGSAQDVLDPASGEQMATLQWSDFDSEELDHVPPGDSTTVTVQLRYEGGELRCHHFCDPCPGLPCGAPSREAYVDLDAELDVSTQDGALDETFDVVATRYSYGTQTDVLGSLPASAIEGTLDVELTNPDFQDLTISVSTGFAETGISGRLNASATQGEPNGPAITVPLATWPIP